MKILNRYSGAVIREIPGGYLRDADLSGANLNGADLNGIRGLPPAPVIPNIDSTILAAVKRDGCRLSMNAWHKCETTHCRAGWAIFLAGKAGADLEARTSPDTAGRLIYHVSRPGKPAPDFYASNEDAMADLERCAAEEKEVA